MNTIKQSIFMFALAFVTMGCKELIQSDAKIVNGKEITDDTLDHIIQISAQDPNNPNASFGCTATWVGPNTVFTAAHCVKENGRLISKVTIARGYMKGAKASKVLMHPRATYSGDTIQPGYRDFAIIVFPENTSSKYIGITQSLPQVGSQMEIVGFGKYNHLDGSSGGAKRIGRNVLKSFDKNYGALEFAGKITPSSGDGSNAVNSQGDSGGPLLVNGELAGVSSSIDAVRDSQNRMLPVQTGNYVAVSDPSVRQFINDSVQKHNLKIAGINIKATVSSSSDVGSKGDIKPKDIALKVIQKDSKSFLFVGVSTQTAQIQVMTIDAKKKFAVEKMAVSGTRSIYRINLDSLQDLKQGIQIQSLDQNQKTIQTRKIKSKT